MADSLKKHWISWASLAISCLNLYAIMILFSQTSYLRRVLAGQKKQVTAESRKNKQVGKKLKSFWLYQGNRGVSLDDLLEGGPIIFYAWAPKCPSCEAISGFVSSNYGKLRWRFVSVTFGFVEEDQRFAERYIKEKKLPFPVYFTKDERFLRQLAPFAVPALWVIGKNRVVAEYAEGEKEVKEALERLRGEKK